MKHLIVIVLGLTFAYYSNAQSTSEKKGPIINFEKTTHDFGQLEEGPEAKCKFKFTNDGDVPLVLQRVTASCGCTKPVFTPKPVMPGESDYIHVGFRTLGQGGRNFSKTITVITNAKENSDSKLKMLTIKGTVKKKPVEPKPEVSPVRITPN